MIRRRRSRGRGRAHARVNNARTRTKGCGEDERMRAYMRVRAGRDAGRRGGAGCWWRGARTRRDGCSEGEGDGVRGGRGRVMTERGVKRRARRRRRCGLGDAGGMGCGGLSAARMRPLNRRRPTQRPAAARGAKPPHSCCPCMHRNRHSRRERTAAGRAASAAANRLPQPFP